MGLALELASVMVWAVSGPIAFSCAGRGGLRCIYFFSGGSRNISFLLSFSRLLIGLTSLFAGPRG